MLIPTGDLIWARMNGRGSYISPLIVFDQLVFSSSSVASEFSRIGVDHRQNWNVTEGLIQSGQLPVGEIQSHSGLDQSVPRFV